MEMCNWCNLTAEEQKWKLTESSSWIVYLADKQDYIGRCVIVLKRHCASLSELTDEEWMDLKRIIDKLESSFKDTLGANLSNWSCLLNDSTRVKIRIHIYTYILDRDIRIQSF